MAIAHVLIADITGSTTLYDRLPNAEALARISAILTRMRQIIEAQGGHCVKSQGDDTLSHFDEAGAAFAAARQMVEADWEAGLSVHAGLVCGEMLSQDADIYGDAVNTAARLAALAKPRELLMSETSFEGLEPRLRALCVPMGALALKGKAAPTPVFSFAVSEMDTQTVIFGGAAAPAAPRTAVSLQIGGQNRMLADGQSLTLGRSGECELVLDLPWVSRRHGRFELRGDQLEYSDHSSTGSTVIPESGQEISLHRRAMLLSGTGRVLIGTRDASLQEASIGYAITALVPESS